MHYLFLTDDHPEANGRKPQAGEESFRAFFELADHGKLTLKMGRGAFCKFAACLLLAMEDDPDLKRDVVAEIKNVDCTENDDDHTRRKEA